MHKSKLLHLLKTLEPEEWKKFPKFIQSPFFKSHKNFLPFYNFLNKYYPDFDSPKLEKEKVFKKIFPGKAYHYNMMGNLMSGFITLTEEYLANLQFQKEGLEKKKLIVKTLATRKDSYDLFQKYNENLIKEVENQKTKTIEVHQELRQLHHHFYYHPTTNRQGDRRQNLEAMLDNLDVFYAQNKLLYLLETK